MNNALLTENAQLNSIVGELSSEVQYYKLREKKMLYFILLLKSKGINVDEVYENEVKAIETERFQKFMTGDEHNLT